LPKNTDSPVARLDAITEAINTHIFRKGPQAFGLPAALTGSGMVFEFELFRELMLGCEAIGGFDKELELKLARREISVLYDDKAVVFDEKVNSALALSAQRSRWMGAQWHFARKFVPAAIREFSQSGNIPYLSKALQMLVPPRVLILMGSLAGIILGDLVGSDGLVAAWGVCFLGTAVAMLISIPRDHLWMLVRDIFHLPVVVLAYLGGLMRSGTANRSFIHTRHTPRGTPEFRKMR
ncbi:glycosyltransferase, partial [Rhodothermus sp. AH-315-K08]|nr:glycosyltransferase [Rhodothermus sp. AH-315-K08]